MMLSYQSWKSGSREGVLYKPDGTLSENNCTVCGKEKVVHQRLNI